MFEGLRFSNWKAETQVDGIVTLTLDRADASVNALNHANFVTFNGTYGSTNSVAPPTLGSPSFGVTAQLPARSLQFSAKVSF